MFKPGLLSAVAALAMTLGAAGAGHAEVVNWTISNGVFSDGGTLNGAFSVDTSTNEITAFDLISTPGSGGTGLTAPLPTQFGTEYSLSSPNAWIWSTGRGYPVFAEAVYTYPDGYSTITSELDLTSLPGVGGGTYSLAGDTEALFADAEFPTGASRTLEGGEAVGVAAVPEPATWALLILGLGMIGLAVRRSREGSVAVAA